MRAALLTQYSAPLEIAHVPEPVLIDDRAAIIEVVSCGICRSDWHVWSGDWAWRMNLQLPHIMGHEIVGRVVDAGDAVRRFQPGDTVILPFHLSCERCEFCLSGRSNICRNYTAIGFHKPGGFAERVHVPAADVNLVHAPATASSELLSLAGCRMATAFHAVSDVARTARGDHTLILGGGGLGTAVEAVLARAGALSQTYDIRRGQGQLGNLEDVADQSLDCVFDTVGGSVENTKIAIRKLKNGGRYIQLGLTGSQEKGQLSVPVDDITKREIRFLGAVGCPASTLGVMAEALAEPQMRALAPQVVQVGFDGLSNTLAAMSSYRNALTVFSPFTT